MAALPPEAPTDPNGASLAPSQRNTPAASSPALPAVALAPTLPSLPPAIEGFDEFLDQDVKKFVSLSEQIGEPVSIQVSRWGQCDSLHHSKPSHRLPTWKRHSKHHANSS